MLATMMLISIAYAAGAVFIFLNSVMEAPAGARLVSHLWKLLAIALSWPLIAIAWPFIVRTKQA